MEMRTGTGCHCNSRPSRLFTRRQGRPLRRTIHHGRRRAWAPGMRPILPAEDSAGPAYTIRFELTMIVFIPPKRI